jgi:hypothetical protein
VSDHRRESEGEPNYNDMRKRVLCCESLHGRTLGRSMSFDGSLCVSLARMVSCQRDAYVIA